jgi:hypothetical protein
MQYCSQESTCMSHAAGLGIRLRDALDAVDGLCLSTQIHKLAVFHLQPRSVPNECSPDTARRTIASIQSRKIAPGNIRAVSSAS